MRKLKFKETVVEVKRVRYPNGGIFEKIIITKPDFTIIVPVLPDGRLVLIDEFRAAAGKRILHFPGGKIDKGETPQEAAKRELLEETGYSAELVEQLGKPHFNAPGVLASKGRVFLAKKISYARRSLERDERGTKTRILTEGQLARKALSGGIVDASTTHAYLLYLLKNGKRPKIRKP